MAAINDDWYGANATRCFPIDDAASAVDDSGTALPSGILVDLSIRFPSILGSYLSLSALAVTPSLVTALFVATNLPAASPDRTVDTSTFTPCAAISVPQPIDVGRLYPIQALAPGVAGWIAFGDGALVPYQGRFSTVAQGQILASLASPYRAPPVTSLAVLGSSSVLGGTIKLAAGQDLAVAIGPATIVPAPGMGGSAITVTEAILFSLINALDRDVNTIYAGTCQARPESGTCAKTPLERISGVGPNCSGTLTIEFPGLTVTGLAGGSGAVLSLARGLAASCPSTALPDPDGTVSPAGGDLCQGVIASTTIDPETCDGGQPAIGAPVPVCPSSYDNFASLPHSSVGVWGDSLEDIEAALGGWTAGLEATPTTINYRGGPAQLVKIAATAPAFDAWVTFGRCTELDGAPLDQLFSTLVRPHDSSAAAGALFAIAFPGGGYQVVWYASDAVLALETVTGGVASSRLASVALDPTHYVAGSAGWAELIVQVQEIAGTETFRVAATLSPAPLGTPPSGGPTSTRLNYTSPAATRPAFSHLFGLAGPSGSSSFAYAFQRERTATNGLF